MKFTHIMGKRTEDFLNKKCGSSLAELHGEFPVTSSVITMGELSEPRICEVSMLAYFSYGV